MNKAILDLDDDFQPYLLRNDYTFVGPTDQGLLQDFIRIANQIAPIVAISRSIHHALSNRKVTRYVLQELPPDTQIRVYVVIREAEQFLIHASIEDYCNENNIDFSN